MVEQMTLNQWMYWTHWKDLTEKTALLEKQLVRPHWLRSSMAEQAPLKR
jgi:hypothetical protein